MEKMLVFSLAIWFGLFLAVKPLAIDNDPKPLPPVRVNDEDRVNPYQQKNVYQINPADRPERPHEHHNPKADPR